MKGSLKLPEQKNISSIEKHYLLLYGVLIHVLKQEFSCLQLFDLIFFGGESYVVKLLFLNLHQTYGIDIGGLN